MPLFEVAILEAPTPKQIEEGASEKLVLAPTPVVAADAQGAGILAVMEHRDLEVAKDRMKVLVRPFA